MFWFIPLAWILQVTESPVAVVVALANVTVKSFDPSGPVSNILLYTGAVLLEWATTYFLATDVAVLVSEVNHTSNIKVPVVALFNVKVNNFFFATLIGIIPQIFLAVSIGSGLEKVIDQNSEVPGITDIIYSADIYLPILAFFGLILLSIFLRKFFYKN